MSLWKSWYEFVELTKNKPPRKLLIKALPFVKERTMALDLGAGALNDSIYLLSERFAHVIAVDKEPVAAEIAKDLPSEKFTYKMFSVSDVNMDIEKHKKLFGTQAENYTKYRKLYPEEVYSLLFSLLPVGSTKILDVACGTGKSTEPLAARGLEVYGCDHDVLMIAEAERQAASKELPIVYAVADVEHLPFEDNTFDAITVGTAFHWFANTKSIHEINRVLKPGGLLFIYWTLTVKELPTENEIPPAIFEKYQWERVPLELRSLEHISQLLSDNGLTRVQTARIPFEYETTVEERVGLQQTASAFELLSAEDKTAFLEEVTHVLTQKLSDRTHFTLEEEVQICHGYTS